VYRVHSSSRARAHFDTRDTSLSTCKQAPPDLASLLYDEHSEFISKRSRVHPASIAEDTPSSESSFQDEILRFFVTANVPFLAAENVHLRNALQLASSPFVVPQRRELAGSILERVDNACKDASWASFSSILGSSGCTLASDGWSTRSSLNFINFMLTSCNREYFHSCDFDGSFKKAQDIANSTVAVIDEVGSANVVQVCMDGAARSSFKILRPKYPKIFYTWCCAHSLDLLIEDICRAPQIATIIKQCTELITLVTNHQELLRSFRARSKKALLRCAVTRFATHYLSMSRIFECREAIVALLASECFQQHLASCRDAEQRKKAVAIQNCCGRVTWYDSIQHVCDLLHPIYVLLRQVDGITPGLAGKVYYRMFVLQEQFEADDDQSLLSSFSLETKAFVRRAFAARWTKMHAPIYSVGFLLDPEFADVSVFGQFQNIDLMSEWHSFVESYFPSISDVIARELSLFHDQSGSFARNAPVETRKDARLYWQLYGSSCPHLQRLSVRIFSQPVSASSCERNWSIFEWFLTERRNRMHGSTLSRMVRIHMNEILTNRVHATDNTDIVPWITECLEVIDESAPSALLLTSEADSDAEE
jgi:hypothetical protein